MEEGARVRAGQGAAMTRRARVGARPDDEVIADPTATAEELRAMAAYRPLVVINHPNCPVDIWWELAASRPLEAQASILYPLVTLEEPGRWDELEDKNIDDWIGQGVMRLPFGQGHALGADCVERVLPLYEAEFPGDLRPRQLNDMRRLVARGLSTDAGWKAAKAAAHRATLDATASGSVLAQSVAEAAETGNLRYAAVAVLRDQQKRGFIQWKTNINSLFLAERRWQWARLQQYLRGEVRV